MLEVVGKAAAKTVEAFGKAAAETVETAAKAAEMGEEIGEAAMYELESVHTVIAAPDMAVIKESSLNSITQSNLEKASQKIIDAKMETVVDGIKERVMSPVREAAEDNESGEGTYVEKTGLTEEERSKIIEETGWSAEIVNCIESMDQYEVYKNAGLHEAVINGRKCLIKDIDMDYVDPKTGLTNRERMQIGRAPIDAKTGEKIELHHIGQDFNSPFAELCETSEHGDGKDGILHDKKIESWRQDPKKNNLYNNVQRPKHWEARATEE